MENFIFCALSQDILESKSKNFDDHETIFFHLKENKIKASSNT